MSIISIISIHINILVHVFDAAVCLYITVYTLYLSSNLKPGVVVSKRLSCVLRGFSTSSFSVQRSPGFGWVGRRHCHFGKLGKHEKVQTISRKSLMEQLL